MPRSFPATRMRRNRASEFARRLVRETELGTGDLIYPIFIVEGEKQRIPVASMPGIDRLSIDELSGRRTQGRRPWYSNARAVSKPGPVIAHASRRAGL